MAASGESQPIMMKNIQQDKKIMNTENKFICYYSLLSLISLLLLPVFLILHSQLLFEIWESHWI